MVAPEQLFEAFLENERAQDRYAERNERRDRVREEHLLPLLGQFLDGEEVNQAF